ncbi:MAG: dihydropteroate synthase [Alphaproteobacteria bacterium]|nr:dihydropteroate synthase [Alphaproteobacteria bacterium]
MAISSGRAAQQLVGAGAALPLAGGSLAFSACEAITRYPSGPARRVLLSLHALRVWANAEGKPVRAQLDEALDRLSKPRPPIGALSFDRPRLMGVINVTPDSFYDGGRYADPRAAIARGRELVAQGADLIDVGGESTRPGATPVSEQEERTRVIPVIEALVAAGATVSIDTRHATIMREAVAAGASVLNDVGALAGEESLATAARLKVPVVLMHGTADPRKATDPRTMQKDPRYDDVVLEVYAYLEERVSRCEAAGIPRERLILDPGIGFAKTPAHNAALLEAVALFHGLGCALLLGVSRKSFIARFSGGEGPDLRLPGSLAAAQWCASQGMQILRVHDVAETRQALAVATTAADPRLLPATA